MTANQYQSRSTSWEQHSDKAFAEILPFGAAILRFYAEHQQLLDVPYLLALWDRRDDEAYRYEIEVAASENPIVVGFYTAGIKFDAIKAEDDDTAWQNVKFPPPPSRDIDPIGWRAMNIRAYALVDLSLYYVSLANFYVPNRGMVRNLFATNVETDALGRTNEIYAVGAVAKIMRKYGPSDRSEDDRARHVIMMMKHDVSEIAISPSARGVSFERECRHVLEAAGFDVRTTPTSGDFGADLIASKDGLGFAIQCKDTSKPVGVKAIQEAVAARSHYKVDFAVVCSTARFTDAALGLATSNDVILADVNRLAQRLEQI